MMDNLKQLAAVNLDEMILRAMEPAELVDELISRLEEAAVGLRTETAKAISQRNRLRDRVAEGQTELASELEKATEAAALLKELLDLLEKQSSAAKLKAEQLAAGTATAESLNKSANSAKQYRKLSDYLESL